MKFKSISSLIIVFIFMSASFYMFSKILPRKYKSTAIVSIDTEYFQHPLIRDFVSEIYDPVEMRSRREALIKQTLNENFLEGLWNKYPHLENKNSSLSKPLQLEKIRESFDAYPRNATSFTISYVSSQAVNSQIILNEYIQAIKGTLQAERLSSLNQLKEALTKKLERANVLNQSPTKFNSSSSLEQEMRSLQMLLSQQLGRYTSEHPEVKRTQMKLRRLQKEFETARLAGTPLKNENLSAHTNIDIEKDLLSKLNYLEVAMQAENTQQPHYFSVVEKASLPTAPVFPKREFVLIWSLLLGAVSSLFWNFVYENLPRRKLTYKDTEEILNLKYFGVVKKLS